MVVHVRRHCRPSPSHWHPVGNGCGRQHSGTPQSEPGGTRTTLYGTRVLSGPVVLPTRRPDQEPPGLEPGPVGDISPAGLLDSYRSTAKLRLATAQGGLEPPFPRARGIPVTSLVDTRGFLPIERPGTKRLAGGVEPPLRISFRDSQSLPAIDGIRLACRITHLPHSPGTHLGVLRGHAQDYNAPLPREWVQPSISFLPLPDKLDRPDQH